MDIQTYFNQIEILVNQYLATDFVAQANLTIEPRPAQQGYLTGSIIFIDSSALHFKEYLDGLTNGIVKKRYSYHYQDSTNGLIFRYDNANHKPPLGFIEHKHLIDGRIIQANAPRLDEVLLEIVMLQQW